MRVTPIVLVALFLGACGPHPWIPVLHGMRDGYVTGEVNTEDQQDFSKSAPEGFEPDPNNKWVLIFYDPATAPQVHASFEKLRKDCYFAKIPSDDEDEPGERHAAVCAFERVPPVPQDEQPDQAPPEG